MLQAGASFTRKDRFGCCAGEIFLKHLDKYDPGVDYAAFAEELTAVGGSLLVRREGWTLLDHAVRDCEAQQLMRILRVLGKELTAAFDQSVLAGVDEVYGNFPQFVNHLIWAPEPQCEVERKKQRNAIAKLVEMGKEMFPECTIEFEYENATPPAIVSKQ